MFLLFPKWLFPVRCQPFPDASLVLGGWSSVSSSLVLVEPVMPELVSASWIFANVEAKNSKRLILGVSGVEAKTRRKCNAPALQYFVLATAVTLPAATTLRSLVNLSKVNSFLLLKLPTFQYCKASVLYVMLSITYEHSEHWTITCYAETKTLNNMLLRLHVIIRNFCKYATLKTN